MILSRTSERFLWPSRVLLSRSKQRRNHRTKDEAEKEVKEGDSARVTPTVDKDAETKMDEAEKEVKERDGVKVANTDECEVETGAFYLFVNFSAYYGADAEAFYPLSLQPTGLVAMDEKDSILASIPADLKEKSLELYASLIDGKGGLGELITSIKKQDPDKVSIRFASSLDTVAELELLKASGLSFLLPEQYLNYPRLAGRGIVEITIEKGDGSTFSAEAGGDQRKSAKIQVVIDGYSAPLTAWNFAKLVTSGADDGAKLNTVNQAVIRRQRS